MEKTADRHNAIHQIRDIKTLFKTGKISEEKAEEMCREPLASINERMMKIAKEFGKKPKLLTFREAMRIRNFYI